MSDNVVFLKFANERVEEDTMAFISCCLCKNKTFTLTRDQPGEFALMRCAACGQHIGRIGWSHDDDPAENGPPAA